MKENNIKYIKYDKDILKIYLNNDEKLTIEKSLKNYIKEIFTLNLNVYNSYKENITTFLKYKRLIPLYINDKIQFIFFKNLTDYQIIINYNQIKSIIKTNNKEYIKIRFLDEEIILLKVSYNNLIKKIKQLKEITLFLKKQFEILNL